MDNNNQTPKHVQVENAKKPEKKYVIFYNLGAKEGDAPQFVTVNNIMEAFGKMIELKSQGAIHIRVFQEVELKVTVH